MIFMGRKPNNDNDGIIYSTKYGKMCPGCGHPFAKCSCSSKNQNVVKGDGTVRVGLETKGRQGKGVTIISGVPVSSDELKVLAKKLKQKCGCGGTVKDSVIEIQGDHRDMLIEELKVSGYRVKRSGG